MPYVNTNIIRPTAYETRYMMPVTMVLDSSLPSYYNIGRYRPYINRCKIGSGSSSTEEIHSYMTDADDGLRYSSDPGKTWLQQCWLMPDMSIRADYPRLDSTVTGTTVSHNFNNIRPWSYAYPITPTPVYKYVRTGNFTNDLVTFSEPLTVGWGGSGHSIGWVGGTPGTISINVKSIAAYLYAQSLPSSHNYCRLIVDFIGLNNVNHEDMASIGEYGFLRDRYSVFSGGGVSYETPDQMCGMPGKIGIGLGDWVYTVPYTISNYGTMLALHLNITGFNIKNTATSSASAIWWDLLPVCTHDEANLPKRACLRISAVSCISGSAHHVPIV